MLIVGSLLNHAYLYDAASGALVTAPFDATQSGTAYVFDATTAQLLHTLSNPTPAANDFFGDVTSSAGAPASVPGSRAKRG